jgi:hypothetical protein
MPLAYPTKRRDSDASSIARKIALLSSSYTSAHSSCWVAGSWSCCLTISATPKAPAPARRPGEQRRSAAGLLSLPKRPARKDSGRYPRVAARWLRRLLEEHPDAMIEEAALAASCLVALPGASYREAAQTLTAMTEMATSGGERKA